MWQKIATLVCLAAAVGGDPAAAADPPGGDLGADVRGVFAARCAGCHGPGLPHPKGRFGYVLDLPRVAANPELVIPARPDESELWVLVDRDEMPPPDSPSGPLTAAEKGVIRAWIAAGSPAAGSTAAGPEASGPAAVPSPVQRAARWLGKFHLVVLHFPVALVLAAGIGEVLAARRVARVPPPAVRFCLALAAVAVVPTVVFGWLHAGAGIGVGSPGLLTAHRWLGTAAGGWVIGAAICATQDARRGARTWRTQVALAVGALLVVATAHAGGLMAHGDDFFDW